MRRTLRALLFLALITQLIVLIPTNFMLSNVQAGVPKPSVPQFTIRFVDASTPEQTTYTVDPYTGQAQQTYHPATHDLKMHITVKNQAYSPTIDDQTTTMLTFSVRVKGHFSEEWEIKISESASPTHVPPDGSGYTELIQPTDYPSGGQIDVQVQAVLWYSNTFEASDWSDTQTVTIPEINGPNVATPGSPTQASTATPVDTPTDAAIPQTGSEGNFNQTVILIAIVAIVVIVIGALSVVCFPRKPSNRSSQT